MPNTTTTPHTLTPPVTLWHGDCLQLMREIPDGSVDCVITDPPYGVLEEYWDNMDELQLAAFTMSWVAMCSKISPYAMVFFGEKTRGVVEGILAKGYETVRQLIWSKGGGVAAKDKIYFSYESIYYCKPSSSLEFTEPKSLIVANMIKTARESAGISRGAIDMAIRGKKTGLCFRWEEAACIPTQEQINILCRIIPLDKNFHLAVTEARGASSTTAKNMRDMDAVGIDVISMPPPSNKNHPTEKPEALMVRLIEMLPSSINTILDPFMGSGSTGVACVALNRQFIGIELDESYYQIACKRIRDAQQQIQLPFGEVSRG